jgi:YD repeat-containing protein
MTSPQGDLTTYPWAYAPETCQPVQLGEADYQGKGTNAVLLKQKTITPQWISPPGFPAAGAMLPQTEATALADGTTTVSSSITRSFDGGFTDVETECQANGTCNQMPGVQIPIGEAASETFTDFTGSKLKEETTSYEWQANNSPYWTGNMLDLPSTTQTLDGAGSAIYAKTTYTYDESAYSSAGTAGLPTTVTRCLNAGCTNSPKTHTEWNASGEKTETIDALNYKTTYDYNGTTSCNGSEITDTYDPLNDHISGTYDCSTGKLNEYTDANGNETTIAFDGMNRLLSVTGPMITLVDGSTASPSTTFCYTDDETCSTGTANTVLRTISATPDPDQTATVAFDGFGREIHRFTATAGNMLSSVEVDTAYDLDGRLYSVTDPFYSQNDPTYGSTLYTYDALNRKLVETQPDGKSTRQWAYSGNTVTVTDEVRNETEQTSDSLDRLTAVAESPTVFNLPTQYMYDPLGNLISVGQNGSGQDTPRDRTFHYDWLSRLITSDNPEAGLICYGATGGAIPTTGNCTSDYDLNGNLLAKTDSRGTETDYSYDALNRLTSKSYQHDGSETPTSCFQYGTPSAGSSKMNQLGRLMGEWTVAGSCTSNDPYVTATLNISYDPLGHLASEQQCTPANCANSASFYNLSYVYDLAGNVNQYTNGIGSLTFSETYDAAGRLLGLTSSLSDVLHPASLFSADPNSGYTAAGGLQTWVLGTNIDSVRTYDDRLRVTGETATQK